MGRRKIQVQWNEDGTKKLCETCEDFKLPSEFHYKTKCEACYQDYQREYREKNREVLAERKRMQRKARAGNREKSKIQLRREMKEKLENALDEGSCRFCPEDANPTLRFLVAGDPNEQFQLEGAIKAFTPEQRFDLICLNCLAKEKHALPQF